MAAEAKMAVLVLTLNLRWDGLNFLGLHISPSQRNLWKEPIVGPGWSQQQGPVVGFAV